MSAEIPVVLFAYARPAHLARVLASLRENGVPVVLAFSDGAKGPADAPRVAEVRAMLRGVDWCDLRLVEREHNLGLGRNVLAGIGEVAAAYPAFVVWEDDLIAVPGTYGWMCAALRHYADDTRVMSISAWTHPRITPAAIGDRAYFDARADCWVWGAYARSWKGMAQPAVEKMRAVAARGIAPGAYGVDLPVMARREQSKNIWAVRWLYHHLQNDGLCLRPPWSMVEHIGFDPDATNAGAAIGWANPPLRTVPPKGPWPEPAEHAGRRAIWAEATRPARAGWRARAKQVARKVVPAAWLRWVQQRFFRVRWTGDHADWAAAAAASSGYDTRVIIERVVRAARQVRDGQKSYERDGVGFDGAPPVWIVRDQLQALHQANPGKWCVLDYGGSLGSHYFQYRRTLGDGVEWRWIVVEQPAFVAVGRREFATRELEFYSRIDEACVHGPPDVLMLGSVLPYLENPLATLRELLARAPRLVVVERTGFVTAGPARLTVQHVPRSIYPASYPCWFLDRAQFLAAMGDGYRLTFEERDDIETPHGLEFRSFTFRRHDA